MKVNRAIYLINTQQYSVVDIVLQRHNKQFADPKNINTLPDTLKEDIEVMFFLTELCITMKTPSVALSYLKKIKATLHQHMLETLLWKKRLCQCKDIGILDVLPFDILYMLACMI